MGGAHLVRRRMLLPAALFRSVSWGCLPRSSLPAWAAQQHSLCLHCGCALALRRTWRCSAPVVWGCGSAAAIRLPSSCMSAPANMPPSTHGLGVVSALCRAPSQAGSWASGRPCRPGGGARDAPPQPGHAVGRRLAHAHIRLVGAAAGRRRRASLWSGGKGGGGGSRRERKKRGGDMSVQAACGVPAT